MMHCCRFFFSQCFSVHSITRTCHLTESGRNRTSKVTISTSFSPALTHSHENTLSGRRKVRYKFVSWSFYMCIIQPTEYIILSAPCKWMWNIDINCQPWNQWVNFVLYSLLTHEKQFFGNFLSLITLITQVTSASQVYICVSIFFLPPSLQMTSLAIIFTVYFFFFFSFRVYEEWWVISLPTEPTHLSLSRQSHSVMATRSFHVHLILQ